MKRSKMHHFDDYQTFTDSTAIYPIDIALPYTALGLVGEIGEYAEKIFNLSKNTKVLTDYELLRPHEQFQEILKQAIEVGKKAEILKKALRGREITVPPIKIWSKDERDELVKELGDSQYYLAQSAKALNLKLSDIAEANVKKLIDRKKRDVIHGEGDNR